MADGGISKRSSSPSAGICLGLMIISFAGATTRLVESNFAATKKAVKYSELRPQVKAQIAWGQVNNVFN
jgi:hypothetical protein